VGRAARTHISLAYVAHTLGWPCQTDMYGGGGFTALANNRLSIGLVIGLEYSDPQLSTRTKHSDLEDPSIPEKILEGGKLVR